jgi:putative ABC transport system permease protein
MNKLILGNLMHRPLRSIISAVAVAIEVVMILSVVAVFFGILNGSRTQQSGTGMDMIVRPGAANALLSSGSASADVRIAAQTAACAGRVPGQHQAHPRQLGREYLRH